MAYRNYGAAAAKLVSPNNTADYTSIQLAINDADPGETIFVDDGTYNEDVVARDQVNICAFSGNASNVRIVGKMSVVSGTSSLSNLTLITNNDYALDASTGSASFTLEMFNCVMHGTNNTAVHTLNANGRINMHDCEVRADSTFDGFSIEGGIVSMRSGSVTTVTGRNTVTNGIFGSLASSFLTGWDLSSTAFAEFQSANWQDNLLNTPCITLADNSNAAVLDSIMSSGTASTIVIGSTATSEVISTVINSTNTFAISGTGTLIIGGTVFFSISDIDPGLNVVGLPLSVVQGGTGASSFTPYSVILAGPNATDPFQNVPGNGILGQVLTSNGVGFLPTWEDSTGGGGGSLSVNIQTFTSSGTYTPTPGMSSCIIECIGGGGGGGGAQAGGGTTFSGGGGGGGASYSRKFASSGTIGASQPVTVGAGGSGGAAGNNNGTSGGGSSVGTICTSNGGGGGGGAATNTSGSGGAGGAVGTGDFTIQGNNGVTGIRNDPSGVFTLLSGASSFFGYGGYLFFNASGTAGIGYGSGGGAGSDSVGVDRSGSDGAPGIVIITEFIGSGGGGGGGSLTWTDISGAVGSVPNSGYFATAATTSTLPATPAQGDVVAYAVDTASVLTITANAGQRIRLGTTLSAIAGTCSSTQQGDSIYLVYRAADTTWVGINSVGMWAIL